MISDSIHIFEVIRVAYTRCLSTDDFTFNDELMSFNAFCDCSRLRTASQRHREFNMMQVCKRSVCKFKHVFT